MCAGDHHVSTPTKLYRFMSFGICDLLLVYIVRSNGYTASHVNPQLIAYLSALRHT